MVVIVVVVYGWAINSSEGTTSRSTRMICVVVVVAVVSTDIREDI